MAKIPSGGTNPNRIKVRVDAEPAVFVKSKTQTPQVDKNKRRY